MSSQHAAPGKAPRIDPDNRLIWKANVRRLEAEVIRDALLAVSGRLSRIQGGPGFFEALPSEMRKKYSFFTWNASSEPERTRRSIYMFQRRNLIHPFMDVFDVADINESCENRQTSVTAKQVLVLMNSEFAHEIAASLARGISTHPRDNDRLKLMRLFELTLARSPTENELRSCLRFLRNKRETYRSELAGSGDPKSTPDVEHRSLADLCLVVLNLNEFLYLD